MKAFSSILAIVTGIAVLAATILACGMNPLTYVDLPSILIVVGLTLITLRISWSFSQMARAFSTLFSPAPAKEALAQAVHFFKTMTQLLMFSGIMAVFMGSVAILKNLADKAMLGPNFAVALLSVFYALILSLLVSVPLGALAHKRLIELESGK